MGEHGAGSESGNGGLDKLECPGKLRTGVAFSEVKTSSRLQSSVLAPRWVRRAYCVGVVCSCEIRKQVRKGWSEDKLFVEC